MWSVCLKAINPTPWVGTLSAGQKPVNEGVEEAIVKCCNSLNHGTHGLEGGGVWVMRSGGDRRVYWFGTTRPKLINLID